MVAPSRRPDTAEPARTWRQVIVVAGVGDQADGELAHAAGAGRAPSGLARVLDRRSSRAISTAMIEITRAARSR